MVSPCTLCHGTDQRRLFAKEGRDFLRCQGCGLVFVSPLPTAEALTRHYDDSYRDGRYAAFASAEAIRRGISEYRLERVRAVARPVRAEERWLDVGCAGGEFVAAAARAGVAAEGLDHSGEAVQRARARGLVAHVASVDDFDPAEPYATITAFDVLEHSLDPRRFLSRLAGWLEPGGSLVLTVPNVDSLYPRFLMGRHWFYYAPLEHLFYFNPRTLERLLHEEGFAVRGMSRTYKPMTLTYAADNLALFNATLGAVATRVVRSLPEGLRSRMWKLYLGEMWVFAERL